jgi:hypothetical protein
MLWVAMDGLHMRSIGQRISVALSGRKGDDWYGRSGFRNYSMTDGYIVLVHVYTRLLLFNGMVWGHAMP